MKHNRKWGVVCGILCLALLGGCTQQETTTDETQQQTQETQETQDETQQDTAQTESAVEWETQVYEDDQLRYEIPASWVKNEEYSYPDMMFTFFCSQDTTSDTPSNVNIQVLSLDNQSKDMDYADPEIQEQYHEFLLSADDIPQEAAKNGVYTTEQIGDTWVYMLSFPRTAEDGTIAQQTAYFPMGLDYAIAIWATDFQDGCTPNVDEVAKHICATLELK